MTAVTSDKVFEELSKLIKFPPNVRDISINLKLNSAAIIEATYYLTINDMPEKFTKKYKLILDE